MCTRREHGLFNKVDEPALGEDLSSLFIRLLNTIAGESDVRINPHSHSMVAGGLLLTS